MSYLLFRFTSNYNISINYEKILTRNTKYALLVIDKFGEDEIFH